MQIPNLSKLAFVRKNIVKFISNKLGGNNIGKKGCEYLKESDWPRMKNINLRSINNESEGVKYLCLANWPCLNVLDISNTKIEGEGADYISKSIWPCLTSIDLQ